MIFENNEELKQKTESSFCLIDGKELVYVIEVGEKGSDYFNFTTMEQGRWGKKDARKKDYTAPALGYVFVGNSALYLSRTPLRAWKVGVTTRSFGNLGIRLPNWLEFGPMLWSIHKDAYKSFSEARTELTKMGATSVPFSRKFAVSEAGIEFMGHLKFSRMGNAYRVIGATTYECDFYGSLLSSKGVPVSIEVRPKKVITGYDYSYDV